MLLACIITNILAIALPSLRIFPLTRVVATMLFCTAALLVNVAYIQSIGSGIETYSGLLFLSLIPIKPAGESTRRRLTNLEKEQLVLTDKLKQILIGIILGDGYGEKQGVNVRFKFEQGIIHKEYLMHL
jgi:hypothetical protein